MLSAGCCLQARGAQPNDLRNAPPLVRFVERSWIQNPKSATAFDDKLSQRKKQAFFTLLRSVDPAALFPHELLITFPNYRLFSWQTGQVAIYYSSEGIGRGGVVACSSIHDSVTGQCSGSLRDPTVQCSGSLRDPTVQCSGSLRDPTVFCFANHHYRQSNAPAFPTRLLLPRTLA
jgi:hypothetical protein